MAYKQEFNFSFSPRNIDWVLNTQGFLFNNRSPDPTSLFSYYYWDYLKAMKLKDGFMVGTVYRFAKEHGHHMMHTRTSPHAFISDGLNDIDVRVTKIRPHAFKNPEMQIYVLDAPHSNRIKALLHKTITLDYIHTSITHDKVHQAMDTFFFMLLDSLTDKKQQGRTLIENMLYERPLDKYGKEIGQSMLYTRPNDKFAKFFYKTLNVFLIEEQFIGVEALKPMIANMLTEKYGIEHSTRRMEKYTIKYGTYAYMPLNMLLTRDTAFMIYHKMYENVKHLRTFVLDKMKHGKKEAMLSQLFRYDGLISKLKAIEGIIDYQLVSFKKQLDSTIMDTIVADLKLKTSVIMEMEVNAKVSHIAIVRSDRELIQGEVKHVAVFNKDHVVTKMKRKISLMTVSEIGGTYNPLYSHEIYQNFITAKYKQYEDAIVVKNFVKQVEQRLINALPVFHDIFRADLTYKSVIQLLAPVSGKRNIRKQAYKFQFEPVGDKIYSDALVIKREIYRGNIAYIKASIESSSKQGDKLYINSAITKSTLEADLKYISASFVNKKTIEGDLKYIDAAISHSSLVGDKVRNDATTIMRYMDFSHKRHVEGIIKGETLKSQWEFESIVDSYLKEDLLDMPNTDYPYENDKPIVYDQRTGEPFKPIGPVNGNEVEVATAVSHPFAQWKNEAQKDIWVNLTIYADVVLTLYGFWKKNSFKIGGMKTHKAITFLLSELRDWIREYTNDNPEYLRVFRMVRWYAEPIVLALKRTILVRFYESWVDKFHEGKQLGEMNGLMIHDGLASSTGMNASIEFERESLIDGLFEFSYFFRNSSGASKLVLYIDDVKELEITKSRIKRESIEVEKGVHKYRIEFHGADIGDIVKLSGFKVTNAEFLHAETRYEEGEEKSRAHKSINQLIHYLVEYYRLHWAGDKKKGAMNIKQRKIWINDGK